MRFHAPSLKLRQDQPIGEEIFYTSLTANIATSFSGSIGPMVDAVMIGNFLPGDAVAAGTLVTPILLIYNLLAGMIAGGSRTLFSHLLGKDKLKEANGVFSLACVLNLVTCVLMTLATFLFIDLIVVLLGAKGSVAGLFDLTKQYLLGYVIGVTFLNMSRILSGYMQIDGAGKLTVHSAVWMTVVDILGDAAVVFVFHGGMFGMGLATSVANIVQFLVLMTHFLKKDRILRFSLKDLPWKQTGKILSEGAPTGVSRIASFVKRRVTNSILASSAVAAAATAAIAACGVQGQMNNLFFALYIGVAEVVWLLSSIYYGEEDTKALEELQKLTLKAGLFLSVFAGVVIFVFARFFALMFARNASSEAIVLSIESIRYFAVALPFLMLTYCFSNYLMGTGKIREANVYSFLQDCGVFIPVVFVMHRLLGVRGVWIAYPLSQAIMLLVAFVMILFAKGKNLREKMLMLPENFGTKAGEELEFMIESMEEAVFMAGTARYFAEENGADEKRGYVLELAVEEMAGNIIQHGFVEGEHHSINLRMLCKDEELIIRMRDDCALFDPKKKYESLKADGEDPTKNIGIRLIMDLAKDVKYISTLNTNNLIIRI